MDFSWTPHRFSGGALALDVANSVILRFSPEKSIDRFAVSTQIYSFALAASGLSGDQGQGSVLVPTEAGNHALLLSLREATDSYFRLAVSGIDDRLLLARLLETAAAALRDAPHDQSLEAATARSALHLIAGTERQRIRICGNCGWLFIDRSKNRSRIWCDMAVCGNRQKAARHYHRTKEETA
jgi:predicted RNA-binding Zn ribbon-like protein